MSADLEAEWEAALADAGISHAAARLYTFPVGVDLGGGRQAVYQAPGEAIVTPAEQRFLEVLNEQLDVHRVGVAQDLAPEIAAAVMRHELEHARQFDCLGPGIFRVQDLIATACWEKIGRAPRGGGVLINASPPELDANAAAARFAWSRHAGLVTTYLSTANAPHEVLFRYESGPEPVSTLLWRALAYAATIADLCEAVALRHLGRPFGSVVEDYCPGGNALWDRLRPHECSREPDR